MRSSAARALRIGRTVASAAVGLVGLSAVSGGGGVVAQPARKLKATSTKEYRFIVRCADGFGETELEFHSAETPDALPGHRAAQRKRSTPNKIRTAVRAVVVRGHADFRPLDRD